MSGYVWTWPEPVTCDLRQTIGRLLRSQLKLTCGYRSFICPGLLINTKLLTLAAEKTGDMRRHEQGRGKAARPSPDENTAA